MTHIKAGMAVLDGKLRSQEFIQFMRERANTVGKLGISNELLTNIKSCLHDLRLHHRIGCLVFLLRVLGVREYPS